MSENSKLDLPKTAVSVLNFFVCSNFIFWLQIPQKGLNFFKECAFLNSIIIITV